MKERNKEAKNKHKSTNASTISTRNQFTQKPIRSNLKKGFRLGPNSQQSTQINKTTHSFDQILQETRRTMQKMIAAGYSISLFVADLGWLKLRAVELRASSSTSCR
ncbi:hypothetical protein Droror1_Dr00013124 [Drosera rotundifolia]